MDADKVSLAVPCQSVFCQTMTCLGCGEAVSSKPSGLGVTIYISGVKLTVHWCCDRGRLAAVWALACGWQTTASKSRVRAHVDKFRGRSKNMMAAQKQPKGYPNASSVFAKGIGYSSMSHHDFLSFPYLTSRFTSAGSTTKSSIDTQGNVTHEAYIRLLSLLLPSSGGETTYDKSPPDFLSHMLSRSPLMEEVASMLSNDSMEDISCQYQIHDAILDLFDALGGHQTTAGLVYDDRCLYHAKGGLLMSVSFESEPSKGRIYSNDTGKPLLTLLKKLATQSQTILRHSQDHPTEFHNQEGQNLLKFCQRLTQMASQHTTSLQRLRTTMEMSDGEPKVDLSQWHRENCIGEAPDTVITSNFAFAREATCATDPALGRMKRLITELSTLQASMPEGVFIRHGSSRLDMMKVLMIGPKGTPYEYGLFEFDLYCGMDYPSSPPKMKFRTTNGGRTRFNPNLYEDGKSKQQRGTNRVI